MMGVAVEQMLDRADARPLVDGVASGQSSPQSPVSSSQRRLGRRLPRWVARPRATRDRLDAGRSRGDPGPWRPQAVLGRSHGDADALRDLVREDAIETLASPDAGLVIDETGFLKQGQSSCGGGRPYTGSAGKITHCQIGVLAAYVSDKGCAFIDRPLDRPQDWTTKPERRPAAHGPDALRFAPKPQRAAQMIERAMAAGVPFDGAATDMV